MTATRDMTLPRKKLDHLELKNFRRYLRYAKEKPPFYREKYSGFEPDDIVTKEDLKSLPLTDKEDLRIAQEKGNPTMYGDILGVEASEVSGFRQASRTQPVYVPESYESWQWRVEIWCHIIWMAGFRESDRVFVPFGYNVYVAFWEGHYAAEKLGCEVVPGGALDTKGRINKMIELQATDLMNTPTYGLHMAEVVGRADELTKIRGVLFTPVSVEEVLREEFPVIGEYEIVVRIKNMKRKIEEIEQLVAEPGELGRGIPAVEKNARSILSFTHVLTFGISDVAEAYNMCEGFLNLPAWNSSSEHSLASLGELIFLDPGGD